MGPLVRPGTNIDTIEIAPLVDHVTETIFGSLSPKTLKTYQLVWKQFLEFVDKLTAKGVSSKLNESHILTYLAYLSKQGLASSTVIS